MDTGNKSRIRELRQELSRRGMYWDLRWDVEELSEWLKVKKTPVGPRSQCELSFRLESFNIKMTPDSLVPFRRLHLRLIIGTKVLVEVPVEEISDQLPPLYRCQVPANSRLSAMEGVTLSVHVVCKDRGSRETLGSQDLTLGKFIEGGELIVRDLTDLGVIYEVKISSQSLSFTNRRFRKFVTFVVAAKRIARLSGLRKAMADAEVRREIAKLEVELEYLLAENDRLKKRLDVELAVGNSRQPHDLYFSPSSFNRNLPSIPPANFVPTFSDPLRAGPAPSASVSAPVAISRPPDPPVTRNLKLRLSEKIVLESMISSTSKGTDVEVPEPPAFSQAAEPQPSVTAEAVDKIQSWYRDLTWERASAQPETADVPVVSKKTAKIDKTLYISVLEISSIVLAKETSWLSTIASTADNVFVTLEIRVLKGTKAIDVAHSAMYPLRGTRVDVKPENEKISVNYVGSEMEKHLLAFTLLIDDVAVAVGGMHLNEVVDDEVTIALSSTGKRLQSDPLLTLRQFPDVRVKTSAVNCDSAEIRRPELKQQSSIDELPDAPKPIAPKAKVAAPTDPKQRAIFIAKQREALVKAKQELITKQKRQAIEEQKFVLNKAKEIAILKKAMPPLDSFKFPGMPGPPPFKPRSKDLPKPAVADGVSESKN